MTAKGAYGAHEFRRGKGGLVVPCDGEGCQWCGLDTAQEPTPFFYGVIDSPKMLRETLCVAQAAIRNSVYNVDSRAREHVDRLGRLINECDRKRPLGPDGKHGDRHTDECGCSDD